MDSSTTFPGARRLLVMRCVQLVAMLGERFAVDAFGPGGDGLRWFRVMSAVWLLFSTVELGLVIAFSRELGTHPAAGRMRLAAGFLAADTLFTVVVQGAFILGLSTKVDLFSLPPVLGWGLPMALGLGFDLAFWFGLDQVVGDAPQRMVLTVAYLFTRALSIARRLFVVLAPPAMRRDVVGQTAFAYGWLAVTVAGAGLVIYMLHRASRAARPDEAGAAPDGVPMEKNDLLWGAVWLGGGLLVTGLSYSAAASGAGGGRYMVTTGAIAYGIVRLFRGMMRRNG